MALKSLTDSFLAALLAALFLQAGAAGFLAGHGLIGSALLSLGLTILIGRLKSAGILSKERLLGLVADILARNELADSFLAALLASLFMQAAAAGFLGQRWAAGWVLLSLGSTILIWRLKASGLLSKERLLGFAMAVLIVVFAAELATLFIRPHPGGAGNGPYAEEQAPGASSGKYRGVILWQDAKPPVFLVPPRPSSGRGLNDTKQTLSIPFDGVYWYFKFPDRQPPKDSYTTRGSPSATTFRSADFMPLQMEARQNFVTPIDMSCCSRITVEILNADRYPGAVSIDLILVNLSLAGQPSQPLGPRPVTSMPQRLSGDNFRPVPEVLSFAIPANPRIRQFDSATVRFLRNGKRGVSSAKIAIERFTLVARGL